MNKDELILIFENNSDDLKIRKIISKIVNKICTQAIKIFFKKTSATLPLPPGINNLKLLLNLKPKNDKILLEAIIEFYFKKVKEQL